LGKNRDPKKRRKGDPYLCRRVAAMTERGTPQGKKGKKKGEAKAPSALPTRVSSLRGAWGGGGLLKG